MGMDLPVTCGATHPIHITWDMNTRWLCLFLVITSENTAQHIVLLVQYITTHYIYQLHPQTSQIHATHCSGPLFCKTRHEIIAIMTPTTLQLSP